MSLQRNHNGETPQPARCELLAFIPQQEPAALVQALEQMLEATDNGQALLILRVPHYFARFGDAPAMACAEKLEEYLEKVEALMRELYTSSQLHLARYG